jgi:hypothetical protein
MYEKKNEKNKKSGCLKSFFIGLGIIGLTYVGINSLKKNNLDEIENPYINIESVFSNLDRDDRAEFISNYINQDSVDISYVVNGLNKDKCINLLDYISSSNILSEQEKVDYVINSYKNLDRKNKFDVVKEITKNSIGF